jgi:hypothetical protein
VTKTLSRSTVLSSGLNQVISISSIFEDGSKDTLLASERYLKSLAKHKKFWNREVLKFLELDSKAIKHFLQKHQEYMKS